MQNAPITKEIERTSGSGYLWAAIGIVLVLAGIFLVVRPMGMASLALGVALIISGALFYKDIQSFITDRPTRSGLNSATSRSTVRRIDDCTRMRSATATR